VIPTRDERRLVARAVEQLTSGATFECLAKATSFGENHRSGALRPRAERSPKQLTGQQFAGREHSPERVNPAAWSRRS
jgi:hypothetical protein